MELLIILVLIVVNGVFSMSETAVIASRKTRLQQQAEKGDKGAQTALELVEEPNRFLSTVQIGITLIGILTGAFGGATVAEQIAQLFVDTPLEPYGDAIGFAIIVAITTYLSLIVGELVPKRLALRSPERIAALVARPMQTISRMTAPLVTLLSVSTDLVLRLMGASINEETPVTEAEIKGMIKQGVDAGVFEVGAHDMVEGIFSLAERRVSALMTPRTEVLWLDVQDSDDEIRLELLTFDHSRLPVGDGDLDHVLGTVHARTLLEQFLRGELLDLRAGLTPALTLPASATATGALELFRATGTHFALVVGEYGDTLGVITLQDILEEIVGDVEVGLDPEIVRRDDGSYLLDGLLTIDQFTKLFELGEIPGANRVFETLGGFVITQRDEIPKSGDHFIWGKLRVEVIDMDGNRVDKVLVTLIEPESAPNEDADNG